MKEKATNCNKPAMERPARALNKATNCKASEERQVRGNHVNANLMRPLWRAGGDFEAVMEARRRRARF